jgi:hypothetical protein
MTTTRTLARWKKIAVGGTLLAGVVVAGIGFLHTPMGRPWLAKAGGCPIGDADPAVTERATAGALLAASGTGVAPTRPALGFALDRATFSEVVAWADSHQLECSGKRANTFYKCVHVDAQVLPDAGNATGKLDEVVFSFRSGDGSLYAVSAWSFGLPADAAQGRMRSTQSSLVAAVGEPQQAAGDVTQLGQKAGITATSTHRFSDYVATVTGSTLGNGVALRQQYSSVRAN